MVRPFDARRDGYVWSEGAAVLVLETGRHAESRGARILARLKGWGAAFGPGNALRRAVLAALEHAALKPDDLGHVKAHGLSTVRDDALEAAVLHDVLPETPVTALKGQLGNAGAAGAVMETAASILALENGCVPPARNYEHPDPACPVRVIREGPLAVTRPDALCLAWMPHGQAAAIVVGRS